MFQFDDVATAEAGAKELNDQEFLPVGEYVASITFAQNYPGDQPGKGYLAFKFRVEEGDYEGKTMPSRFYYGDEKHFGEAKIFALIQACGFTPGAAIDEAMLVGCKLVIVVTSRLDKKNNVQRVDITRTKKLDDASAQAGGKEPWEN